MAKHRVTRRAIWCSTLIASFVLLSGGLFLAVTSSSAGADTEGSSGATLTTGATANKTPNTNNGNGNAEHTPGVKSTSTSRTPPRSGTDEPADEGSVVPTPSGDTEQSGGVIVVPTIEIPEFPWPSFTIPGLPIPGLPNPGSPAPSAPGPASSSAPVSATPTTTEASEPAPQQADPLSDPPAVSDPKPVARNCLVGAGSSGGCTGAGVARDLSPAGLLVLGSVALLGSGAFLESLRGGSRG
jgi:hypothetical protein